MNHKGLLSLTLLLTGFSCYACECFWGTVKDDFTRSDVVFKGRVIRVDTVNVLEKDEYDRLLRDTTSTPNHFLSFYSVVLQVDKVYKGKGLKDSICILTAGLRSQCGVEFFVGKSSIVYALRRDGYQIDERAWNSMQIEPRIPPLVRGELYETSSCLRTQPYSSTEERKIASLARTDNK